MADAIKDTPKKRPIPAPSIYHGLVGEIVQKIAPQSEADPIAVYTQLITALGNAIGRGPYFLAEADQHGVNLFTVIVGRTSKGRKGTAAGIVLKIMSGVDPKWHDTRIIDGLSTGEGLILQVWDGDKKTEGVKDKRLMVVETEFSSVLKHMERKENILSEKLRTAWERRTLNVVTRGAPLRATGAHISVIGHITQGELIRRLLAIDVVNGLANRFLYFWAERVQLLPDGGTLEGIDIEGYQKRLQDVLGFAQKVGEMRRDDNAAARWRAVYPALSCEQDGFVADLTARSEAQVMRLACLYALLDKSGIIRVEHLEAALALWRYAEESVHKIYEKEYKPMVSPQTRDAVQLMMEMQRRDMTRTEIRDFFHCNRTEAQLDLLLAVLSDAAGLEEHEKATRGRPAKCYRIAVPA